MGIGEGPTLRQAKINCAKEALKNLEAGRVLEKPMSKNGLMAFLRENNEVKELLTTDPDVFVRQQELTLALHSQQEAQRRQDELEQSKNKKRLDKEQAKVDEKQRIQEEKKKAKEIKEMEKLQDKERKKMVKMQEKRLGAMQKYSISLEEQAMFEAYTLLRSHEIQLQLED